MSQAKHRTTETYLSKFKAQFAHLNETTIAIWFCGTLFTRLATGQWLGERPVFVLLTILTLVYLYMHLGYYHTMMIRFPIVLLLLYLGQTHLIQPGDFLLGQAFILSWKHLILVWAAFNVSFVFRADRYPFRLGTLHWPTDLLESGKADSIHNALSNVITLPLRKVVRH